MASPSRKVGSSFVLRPNQSAELRCRAEVGVVGFGFFSGVGEVTSSVENLTIWKKVQFSLQFTMAGKRPTVKHRDWTSHTPDRLSAGLAPFRRGYQSGLIGAKREVIF